MTTTTTPPAGVLPKYRPTSRTITKRREAMAEVKRQMTKATNLLAADDHVRTEGRVRALLWAEAFIQQALAMETRGHLGNRLATAASVRRDYLQGR